jgi:hypothetical protein
MNNTPRRGVILIAAAMLLTACGSGGISSTNTGSGGVGGTSTGSGGGVSTPSTPSTGSGGGVSTPSTPSTGSGGGVSSPSTGSGGGSSPSTGSGGGSSPSTGSGGSSARFNLIASPDNASCNYIPNGALSGADLLSIDFYFLIIGGNPSDVPGGLSVTGSSDTGLYTHYYTSPNNQALSVAKFALRSGDFGVLHTIKVVVDSANQVEETDESDNTIIVSVRLPSQRPISTIDPLACTVTQG